jgi:hypothetical protein
VRTLGPYFQPHIFGLWIQLPNLGHQLRNFLFGRWRDLLFCLFMRGNGHGTSEGTEWRKTVRLPPCTKGQQALKGDLPDHICNETGAGNHAPRCFSHAASSASHQCNNTRLCRKFFSSDQI